MSEKLTKGQNIAMWVLVMPWLAGGMFYWINYLAWRPQLGFWRWLVIGWVMLWAINYFIRPFSLIWRAVVITAVIVQILIWMNLLHAPLFANS